MTDRERLDRASNQNAGTQYVLAPNEMRRLRKEIGKAPAHKLAQNDASVGCLPLMSGVVPRNQGSRINVRAQRHVPTGDQFI